MKGKWRKLIALFAVVLLSIGIIKPLSVKADDEDYDGEATVYIGFGGDKAEENDWGYQYNDPENAGNCGDIVATDGVIKVGDTVTVSLEFPEPVVNTWWVAPVILAEGISELDATVTLKIDDKEVDINAEAGDAWWYETTGDFSDTQAIRLAGGFNEWGAQYIEEPSGFKKIEYTITLNSAKKAPMLIATATEDFDGEATAFIGFGGDKAEENDWGFQYNSPDNEGNTPEITATNATLKVGDTVTISLEFPEPVVNTWWLAPVLVADNIVELDATVSLKIDDKDVEIDTSAGDAWWYETTGDYSDTQAIRLAGGFNEWAAQYISEPSGFKKIEYTITLNSAKVGSATATDAEEPSKAAGEVDKNGKYNAYIGIQTPKYSFRNAWYDAYGKDDADNPGFFDRITAWDAENNAYGIPGEIHDAAIEGNGTYTVSITGLEFPDGEFNDQDYMNLIFVSTDIPNTGDITISDMTLKINGSSVQINPIVSPDSEEYLTMLIQNIWNEDVATIGYYNVPFSDIAITFNVSGFDYDNPDAVAPSDDTTQAGADTTAPANDATTQAAAEKKGGLSGGAIAGIVIGAIVVIGGGIGAGVAISKKKKEEGSSDESK